ncbi:hypothetical protein V6N11_061543 [Hibiscus sabdariffa]|uniref:Secreted protein n=2 Tax=Hibiscus sabdariffa TaxID=183260 RepID=A0ABR2AYV5_9ROSI
MQESKGTMGMPTFYVALLLEFGGFCLSITHCLRSGSTKSIGGRKWSSGSTQIWKSEAASQTRFFVPEIKTYRKATPQRGCLRFQSITALQRIR